MKDRRNQLEKPDCHTVLHGACRGYCQLYDAYSEALDHIKRLEERLARKAAMHDESADGCGGGW